MRRVFIVRLFLVGKRTHSNEAEDGSELLPPERLLHSALDGATTWLSPFIRLLQLPDGFELLNLLRRYLAVWCGV